MKCSRNFPSVRIRLLQRLYRRVNMLMSKILAIAFANEQMVATDHIKLDGVASLVQPPHRALKQLGMQIALKGYFSEGKA